MTARYPTGGFNGFYIQTAAPAAPPTPPRVPPTAIFVFGPSADAARRPRARRLRRGDRRGQRVRPAPDRDHARRRSRRRAVAAAHRRSTRAPRSPTRPPRPAARPTRASCSPPTDTFTVTNTFNTNHVRRDRPGHRHHAADPADRGRATPSTADVAGVAADNAARAVVLDDGAEHELPGTSGHRHGRTSPLPWLTPANPVRVGCRRPPSPAPGILEFRNSVWKFQPHQRRSPATAPHVATFEQHPPGQPAPQDVGGDLSSRRSTS